MGKLNRILLYSMWSLHLQLWGHGSLLENVGVLTSVWKWVAAPNERSHIVYVWVLFTSMGTMEHDTDRQIGAVSAVMLELYRTVVMKRELIWKVKLSIYQIHIQALTYGYDLWVEWICKCNWPKWLYYIMWLCSPSEMKIALLFRRSSK